MEKDPKVKDAAIVELYGMIQDSKSLLLRWKNSKRLDSAEYRQLRIATDNFLLKSSTEIAQKAVDTNCQHGNPIEVYCEKCGA